MTYFFVIRTVIDDVDVDNPQVGMDKAINNLLNPLGHLKNEILVSVLYVLPCFSVGPMAMLSIQFAVLAAVYIAS
jgi:hypothetical protein